MLPGLAGVSCLTFGSINSAEKAGGGRLSTTADDACGLFFP